MGANRVCTMVLVWAMVAIALVSPQLTFSRDWAGGKRSAPQLSLDCAQFTRLCRHFVHELKQAMSPRSGKHRARPRRPDTEDVELEASLNYEDE